MAILVTLSLGQEARQADLSRHIEIRLPPPVPSEGFLVRYVLAGQDLGGWVHAPSGVPSFGISTMFNGRPATGMKAILYAPGCAIQTLDLKFSGPDSSQYSFVCEPVRNVEVRGVLARSDRLWGHAVKLQAKYIARWAQPFLGLDDTPVTSIVVGEMTDLSADGSFRLVVPDFSRDLLRPNKSDAPGEFQIWAKDVSTEAIVAMLVPQHPERTRMGGLRVQTEYPAELTFTPCSASSARVHDKLGFAIRPGTYDACDHFRD
jgi:hypothetical protein